MFLSCSSHLILPPGKRLLLPHLLPHHCHHPHQSHHSFMDFLLLFSCYTLNKSAIEVHQADLMDSLRGRENFEGFFQVHV